MQPYSANCYKKLIPTCHTCGLLTAIDAFGAEETDPMLMVGDTNGNVEDGNGFDGSGKYHSALGKDM